MEKEQAKHDNSHQVEVTEIQTSIWWDALQFNKGKRIEVLYNSPFIASLASKPFSSLSPTVQKWLHSHYIHYEI